jgi:hypothetical protein
MALQWGSPNAPLSITTYLDSVFATSLANYRKMLVDNIGAANAVFYEIIKSEAYEEADGGTYIAEELMYALSPTDSYSGYDELSTTTTDGITQAQFPWAQVATPISYNELEVVQNEHRIINLVKSRITQATMGIQEYWSQAWWWGAAVQGGQLSSPRFSTVNGSLSINPLPQLVSYTPTSGALTVGGLSDGTNSWWANQTVTSTATTYSTFIREMLHVYNNATLGTGGPPTHMFLDQTSYETFCHAYFAVYKASPDALDQEYPFEGKRFLKAKVIMDDKVPDAFSGTIPTLVGGIGQSGSTTYGTNYCINAKFLKIRYHRDRDWEMLKDENGKTFAKPITGDSRLGHVAWMGNTTINNRRKHVVQAKISKTIAA